MCDYSDTSGQSLRCDLDIIWTDWRTLPFKITSKLSGNNSVFRGERNDIKGGKEQVIKNLLFCVYVMCVRNCIM